MSARDSKELKLKAARAPGKTLTARRQAISRHIEEAKTTARAETAGSYEKKMVQFLEDKALANEALWAIYNNQAEEEMIQAFYDASVRTWTVEIPAALSKLEGLIKGPFVLGDQIVRLTRRGRES